MKIRPLLVLAALGAALLVPTAAEAAPANGLAEQTQLILTADRLVPVFSYSSTKVTQTNGNTTIKDTTSGSSTSLLFGSEPLGVRTIHTVPRVAFDFAVIPHLTVGGALAFAFSLGGSHEVERNQNNTTTTVKVDSPSTTVIGIAPRVGYVIPFGEVFAFWPRAGFGFYSVRQSTEDEDNNGRTRFTTRDTIFSLDLDPQFAIVPIEHFFFHVGPILNIPLSGSRSSESVRGATTTTVDNDLTVWHFGVSAGLGGWFNL